MSPERFEPQWPNEYNDDGIYLPEDLDSRAPHPPAAPKAVFDIISSTYHRPSHKQNNNLSGFKLFPKLPLELRRAIWRYSLPGRRVVEGLYDDGTGQFWSRCPIPTALHVNSEARGVALETYQLAFATQKANAMIYFDFSIDALYVGLGNFSPSRKDPGSLLFRSLQGQDLARLEHLIMDDPMNPFYPDFDNDEDTDGSESDVEDDTSNSDSVIDDTHGELKLCRMGSLKSLTIVHNDGDNDVVIQETEDNTGELHVWNILKDGKPVPWQPPFGVDFHGTPILQVWCLVELAKFNGDTELTTVRYVTWERLHQEEAWEKRVQFLSQVEFPERFSFCLYPTDGIIDRMLEWEWEHPDLYDKLHDFCEMDPECLYVSQTSCICPIGHGYRHQPKRDWVVKDLRKALAIIDREDDGPVEEELPGAFAEDPIAENEATSHPIQSPAEEVAAASTQDQFTGPKSTSPAEQGSSLSKYQLAPIPQPNYRSFPVESPFLHRLMSLLDHYYPSKILGILTALNEVVSLGFLIYAMSTLDISKFRVHLRGFAVCLFMNRLGSLTQATSQTSPDFLVLAFYLPWQATLSVFSLLMKGISYMKTIPASQNTALRQSTSSTKTRAAVRRRAYRTYSTCLNVWVWFLLIIVGLALAFCLLRFLVELLSVLILLVAALWLLAIWLKVHEQHY